MQATQKKTTLDKADMLLKKNFWKVTKLTIAAAGVIVLTGVLMASLNFTLANFKQLRSTIES